MISFRGLLLVALVGQILTEDAPSLNFLGEGTDQLTLSILQSEADNRTNLVFSPFGYSVILAILSEGSREKTRNQLTSYLHFPEDTYALRTTFKGVLSLMQIKDTVNQPEFRNWFYVKKNFSVEESYKTVLSENYLTEVKVMDNDYVAAEEDTSGQQETSTTDKNKPLEEVDARGETTTITSNDEEKPQKKRNLEKEIMSSLSANKLSSMEDNSTTPELRMIVFNALYYRGKWKNQFTLVEGGTKFECPDGETRSVPSIHSEGEFEYGRLRQLRAAAINIPYEEDRYSLLVILPDRGETLPSLIKRLPKLTFSQIDAQLTKRQVKVTLPKFDYYSITRPKDALIQEGVEDIFNENADLSGITGEKGLYLNDLVQLVTIEVNENSGKYNFLTTTDFSRATVPEFIAQRPFLYFLRDRVDNFVVVAGKVEAPLEKEP